MKSKGFTLIELLVVIAIIGILSSVVLASLTSARSKGTDAAISSNLANMRAQAELYYGDANNYGTAAAASTNTNCTTANNLFGSTTAANTLKNLVGAASTAASSKIICTTVGSPNTAWAVMASTTAGSWCVDSSGQSKLEAGNALPDAAGKCI